jgi:squalene cyclase
VTGSAIDRTYTQLVERLLGARSAGGYWKGELSSSALSTATAVVALSIARAKPEDRALVDRGLDWLVRQQNADGGWGDTTISRSNISTTALCWAALADASGSAAATAVERCEAWLSNAAGGLQPHQLGKAIEQRYGKDRTFSVPILTTLALTGRLGADGWKYVSQLPFELAACPPEWFQWLQLPVVSYALPALIAMGHVRHHNRPSRNLVARALRTRVRERTSTVLRRIQPSSGGYLEATPLTSFVVMSLAGAGEAQSAVAEEGLRFLRQSARGDGSWPIDTNLATWVTTLSVNALASSADGLGRLDASDRAAITEWLLDQQHRELHPYTQAAPGGWAWTPLPGGVPDADDTAGAVLALAQLGATEATEEGATEDTEGTEFGATEDTEGTEKAATEDTEGTESGATEDTEDTESGATEDTEDTESGATEDTEDTELGAIEDTEDTEDTETINRRVLEAATLGIRWLLDLQNRDGGIPTFCRGWGALPFDRSSPDLTAHALVAWAAWRSRLPQPLESRVRVSTLRALRYLGASQTRDGSWLPLWFGNELAPEEVNATYGTAKIVIALAALDLPHTREMTDRGVHWICDAQNGDGGWGGARGVESSIEETSFAVDALAAVASRPGNRDVLPRLPNAIERGLEWLVSATDRGTTLPCAPIGLYFAKLWYYERLYPLIFAAGAIGRARALSL